MHEVSELDLAVKAELISQVRLISLEAKLQKVDPYARPTGYRSEGICMCSNSQSFFFTGNSVFGHSRRRPIQPRSRFSVWSDPGDRLFEDTPPSDIDQIPTPILVFPSTGQAPMPPYGQIRSQTSGFM